MAIKPSMTLKLTKALLLGLALLIGCTCAAQQVSKRLILKSGEYQLATEWEKKGDRVRFFSSERKEWEELPDSLVDWSATEKWNAQNPGKALLSDEAKKEGEEKNDQAEEPEELKIEGIVMPETGGIYTIEHDV